MEVVLDLLYNYIGEITAFILGIGVIAGFLVKAKLVLKKAGGLLIKAADILEDGKVTKAEVTEFIAELKDFVSIFKLK